jgi:anhydro-N-acetylmuramic acid kinase
MRVMGLMSGTSLDGIDVTLLELEKFPSPEGGADELRRSVPRVAWRVAGFRSRPYSDPERDEIRTVLEGGGPRDLALLHTHVGEWFARSVLDLLDELGVSPEAVAALGSHGQTVWHEPPREGGRGSSLQLGCPSTLAERTGIPVVSDLRARDLAAGGHGAPLVPWADAVMFSQPGRARAIQNLGGMANVTLLPADEDPSGILAFDTGPGVALLDAAAEMATGGEWRFDRDGALARKGRVAEAVLDRLMEHPFFRAEPPRSTGREVFGLEKVREARTWMEEETGVTLRPGVSGTGWPDLLATLTALTARTVGESFRRWVVPRGVDEVFLMGGGARNPALRDALRSELEPLAVRDGADLGLDPDARESAAFALLAWAHLQGLPANIPQATGAAGPRVLGSLTPGRNR